MKGNNDDDVEKNLVLPPPEADEYDVPFCHEHGPTIQVKSLRNMEGTESVTVFWGYAHGNNIKSSPTELCGLVRNKGDVILAINGVSTKGKTHSQVLEMLNASCQHQTFSILRFRDIRCMPSYELQIKQIAGEISWIERRLLHHERMIQRHAHKIQEYQSDLELKVEELKQIKLDELRNRQKGVDEIVQELAASMEMKKVNNKEMDCGQEQNGCKSRNLNRINSFSGRAHIPNDEEHSSAQEDVKPEPVFSTSSSNITLEKKSGEREVEKTKLNKVHFEPAPTKSCDKSSEELGRSERHSSTTHSGMDSSSARPNRPSPGSPVKSARHYPHSTPRSNSTTKDNREVKADDPKIQTHESDSPPLDVKVSPLPKKPKKRKPSPELEENWNVRTKRRRIEDKRYKGEQRDAAGTPSKESRDAHQGSRNSTPSTPSLKQRLASIKSRIRECHDCEV